MWHLPLPHSSWSSRCGWKCAGNGPGPSGVSWSQRNPGWAQSKQRFFLSPHSWFLARECPRQFWQQWMLMDTCQRGEAENSRVERTLCLQIPGVDPVKQMWGDHPSSTQGKAPVLKHSRTHPAYLPRSGTCFFIHHATPFSSCHIHCEPTLTDVKLQVCHRERKQSNAHCPTTWLISSLLWVLNNHKSCWELQIRD